MPPHHKDPEFRSFEESKPTWQEDRTKWHNILAAVSEELRLSAAVTASQGPEGKKAAIGLHFVSGLCFAACRVILRPELDALD